jgi:hypothetical protein
LDEAWLVRWGDIGPNDIPTRGPDLTGEKTGAAADLQHIFSQDSIQDAQQLISRGVRKEVL